MRIFFTLINLPKRAADHFLSLFGGNLNFARDITAFVLGYSCWTELRNHINKEPETRRDEECSPEELAERRRYQQARLTEYLLHHGAGMPPEDFIGIWQPSAARPQQNAESFVRAEEWRRAGNETKLLFLMDDLLLRERLPNVVEQAFLLDGITNARSELSDEITSSAGPIAIRLIEHGDEMEQGAGMRLFERMIATGDPYARVSLAKTLVHYKQGGPANRKRAMDLLNSVENETFLHPHSYIEMYTTIAELCLEKGAPFYDPPRALRMLTKAAERGHGESAWYAALFYDDDDDDAFRDWRGHVPVDPVRALDLYCYAMGLGVKRSVAGIQCLIERHPNLEVV